MIEKSTLNFLAELKSNNNKPWFDAHRKQYEQVKENYLRCTEDILRAMKLVDPKLELLTAKDCVFRINRDVRFSADKSPYKTNIGIAMHSGGKKFNKAAYYIHIEPGHSFVGGGLWMPETPLLNKVRKEINFFYSDLLNILNEPEFKKLYKDLDIEEGQKLSRPPKGYDSDNPAIEYLKLKSFTASTPINDEVLTSSEMIPEIVRYLTILKPVLYFINRGLESDDEGGI
jgi:uncharacterized protein (TIGR02453 family)